MSATATALDVIEGRASWALHLGDVLDPASGLPSLPDKCVAHTFADPPYEAEAHSKGRRIRLGDGDAGRTGKGVKVKAISYDPITDGERQSIARHVHRVTRGWSITFCQSEAAMLWRASFEAVGARYIRTGVYWKHSPQPQLSGDRPGVGWEAVAIHWHGAARTAWNGGGKCARWDARRDDNALVDGQKPLALLLEMIADFTCPGDVILSPYGGAGTELLAAMRLGRRGFAWEKSERHYAIARNRLETGEARPAPGQTLLFGAMTK